MTRKRLRRLLGCAAFVLSLSAPSQAAPAAASRIEVPLGVLGGLRQAGPADPRTFLHLALELQPRSDLEGLARAMSDPANPQHRHVLGKDAFLARFGRLDDARKLAFLLRADGASDVAFSADGLVAGGIMRLAQAERAFHVRWMKYTDGTRTVLAPDGPLTVSYAGVRDVRGAVVATTPRLNDVRPSFTFFRGDWYEPQRFRTMTDAIAEGGAGQRIAIVEDASDRFNTADIGRFLAAPGAPDGDAKRVTERDLVFKSPSSECGRDDRGQEGALDVDGALTMAPKAEIVVDYDDVCAPGNDGTLALAHALDTDPTVVVFPFSIGPVDTTIESRYGLVPLPQLEAIVRGIPLVVPAGDDGAYGYREPGIERPRIAWPCASPYVVCAGGTQLGDRDNVVDEAPWNDLEHATGGGITGEPRPAWQNAPGDYVFSPSFVRNRMVPDLAADAAGHLRVYWHGYGLGGVGGTSESASLAAAEIAAVNSFAAPQKRLLTTGDLYALARTDVKAFRDVQRENDRGWKDNTLRPRPTPLPKTFTGIRPTPAPLVRGCVEQQPDGCTVTPGYDAVTGLGDLMERAAVDALR